MPANSASVTVQRREVVSIGNLRFERRDANYAKSMNLANEPGRRAALGSDIDALNQKDRKALGDFLYNDYKEDRERGGFAWLGDRRDGRPSFRVVDCFDGLGRLGVFDYDRPECVARWVAYVETAREADAPQNTAISGQLRTAASKVGAELPAIKKVLNPQLASDIEDLVRLASE